MAETTPHPDPLPPQRYDCCAPITSPNSKGDGLIFGGVGCLAALIFIAGLVIGALWL